MLVVWLSRKGRGSSLVYFTSRDTVRYNLPHCQVVAGKAGESCRNDDVVRISRSVGLSDDSWKVFGGLASRFLHQLRVSHWPRTSPATQEPVRAGNGKFVITCKKVIPATNNISDESSYAPERDQGQIATSLYATSLPLRKLAVRVWTYKMSP